MRRKLILALVVIVLVAAPISPAVLGWHAEQAYETIGERISADHPELDWQIEEFERGWLTSTASYRLEVEGNLAELLQPGHDGPLILHGRDRIRHGPWVGDRFSAARVDSELRAPEWMRALGQDEVAGEAIINARSHIDTLGNVDSQFHFPDHRVEFTGAAGPDSAETVAVEWRDAGGRGGIEGDLTRILVHVPDLRVTNESGDEVSVSDFEIGDRSRRASDGLWLGRFHVAVAEVAFVGGDTEAPDDARLRDFELRSETDADDDHVSAETRMTYGEFDAGGITFSDADIHTRVEQLARAPMARLAELASELQTDDGGDIEATEAALYEALDDLLRGSPKLTTERMQVETPAGRVTGDLALHFDGDRQFRAAVPISLFEPLAGHLELRLPRELVRRSVYAAMRDDPPADLFTTEMDSRTRQQVDQAINILVATGLIEREEDTLVVRIDKEAGGPALVNDQDIMAMIQALGGLFEQQ